MPLMRDWTEIVVDEDLLAPVVRELLALATDPNHVEVVYGTTGRVILADVELAEIWYQSTLKAQPSADSSDDIVAASNTSSESDQSSPDSHGAEEVDAATMSEETTGSEDQDTVVVAGSFEVVAAANKQVVEPAEIPKGTDDLVPLPVKRGPGRPRKTTTPSASNGEDA